MAYTFKHGDRPLDDFTIQRAVGRGGFGEVYYAISDGGREVALKYLKENPQVELRDETVVRTMRVREVKDPVERARLWTLAVAAFAPYAEYQTKTARQIPVFVAEP